MSNELIDILRVVIKEELQPIKEELQQLNRRVGIIETRVENIEARVENIETRVETIEKDIIDLKETTSKMETKLNSVYEQTAKLTEYHGETLARFEQLATKDDLDYFDKKISEHDREIFKIKNRV